MRLFSLALLIVICASHSRSSAEEPAKAKVCVQMPGPCGAVAFTQDGKRLVATAEGIAGSGESELWIWDAAGGKRIHGPLAGRGVIPGIGMGSSVAVSHDGKRAITGSYYGFANLWDLTTGTQLAELPCYTPTDPSTRGGTVVEQVAFSPDEKTAVTLEWKRDFGAVLRKWDSATGKAIGNPEQRASRSAPLQFTAEGNVQPTENGFDALLKLPASKSSENDRLLCSSYSPDGKRGLTGTFDGRVFIWNMKDRKPEGDALVVKPTDKKRVAEELFHEVEGKMSRAQFGALIGDLPFMTIAIAISEDSKTAAVGLQVITGQYANVWIWDLEKRVAFAGPLCLSTAESRRALKDLPESVALTGLKFSPDGRKLAIVTTQPSVGGGKRTGEVQIWDVPSRK